MSIFSIVVVAQSLSQVWLFVTPCTAAHQTSLTQHTTFMVQLSQACMTTGKAIALTRQNFVSKIISLLFNMLSRLVIAFLPRSKQVSLNFMVAVIIFSDFGAQEDEICHYFYCITIYFPWSDGTGCHDLKFMNVEF